MTIQDLGAIGELIGAVAVIITLIYLAVQTRLTRIATEHSANLAKLQASGSVVEGYARWRTLIVGNPAVVESIMKANRGEEISDVEKAQISAVFEERIIASASSYMTSFGTGALHSISADVDFLLQFFRDNPAALSEWERLRQVLTAGLPELVSKVDASIAKFQNEIGDESNMKNPPNKSLEPDA